MATETLSKPSMESLDASLPGFYEEPNWPTYPWIHENSPIYRVDNPSQTGPFWNACTHDLIRIVATDPELFTSTKGAHLQSALYAPSSEAEIPDDPRLPVAMRSIMVVDPPNHKRLRSAVAIHFRPNVVKAREERVRKLIKDLVDGLEAGQEIEFMEWARRVPLVVTTDWLGVSLDRADDFGRWGAALVGAFEPGAVAQWDEILEMVDFLDRETALRREQPRDDLMTSFVQAPEMEPMEIVMWCYSVLVGGLETTEYLLGHGMRHLLRNPDEMAKLVADPSLIQSGVGEMMRFSQPARYISRTVTRPVEIAGQQLEADEPVVMNYTVANFDPKLYEDPFEFRVTRKQNEGLQFSVGPRHCLGSTFSKMESRVAFEELFARFPKAEPAGEPKFRPSLTLNHITSLPIRLLE